MRMSRSRRFLLRSLCLFAASALAVAPVPFAHADVSDGPLSASTDDAMQKLSPSERSAKVEELLNEAQHLFIERKPIDARSKLLKALQLAPNDYRPHMHLGEYYLIEVGHFRLAHRYLRTAEELFKKQFGVVDETKLDEAYWRDHANLLYLLAESRLNLDNYQGALDTVERFEKLYWRNSLPGTKAWILMKLKRLDDAIRTAQAGLLRGAEPGRTYNILGILLSIRDSRELSLSAFSKAIKAERALGALGQPATPLNNAGEVYREMFQDDLAEAAFVQALSYPDGCEHILPSLNLAMLYIDEVRLFQAERVLRDFEACFAQNAVRSDTEHRALIALARGRIELRKGDVDAAIKDLEHALSREQWFGKIGTNANDVQFAALLSMAAALNAKAAVLEDRIPLSLAEAARQEFEIPALRIRAWWLNRRARNLGIDQLDSLEDISIRNTDTMLEYPTFGEGLSGLPVRALRERLRDIEVNDERAIARAYYALYRATNLLAHGSPGQALPILQRAYSSFREIDRLVRAETIAQLLHARRERRWFWSSENDEEHQETDALIEELFELLPSHVRFHGFLLPVAVESSAFKESDEPLVEELKERLLQTRFSERSGASRQHAAFALTIYLHYPEKTGGAPDAQLLLKDRRTDAVIAQLSRQVQSGDEVSALVNDFVDKVFSHRADPPPAPVPALEILSS
ncbi:MAG: hypothetical protein KDD44_00160 [Bdellovibrionales bacterium]|nr:hypothetical protein [Bdellovibrionales bacterium]